MTALWLLLISPFVGSFLGVLADRLPRAEDVVRAPSRCRACGRRLGWAELVPVLSWSLQRGRCRGCGASLPGFLPLIELGAVAAAVLALRLSAAPGEATASALWLWFLLALAVTDWRDRVLPDALTGGLALSGLAVSWLSPGQGWVGALVSAAAGAGALAALRVAYRELRGREGLGLGDVKLMAGIGAALPLTALPSVTLVAACAGLALAVLRRDWWSRTAELPFGAFLAAAAALVWAGLRI